MSQDCKEGVVSPCHREFWDFQGCSLDGVSQSCKDDGVSLGSYEDGASSRL